MDHNGNTPNDAPGPSRMPNKDQENKDSDSEAGPSTSRKRNVPYVAPLMDIADSEESDEDIGIAAQANMIVKKRRINNSEENDEPIYVVPIYVSPNSPNYPNINIPIYEPLPYSPTTQYSSGIWLLITNIPGGWTKEQVKKNFIKKLNLRCHKSIPFPGVCLGPSDFRLMLSFLTHEAREFVVRHIQSNFYDYVLNYIPIDNIPFGSLESDSDDDVVSDSDDTD